MLFAMQQGPCGEGYVFALARDIPIETGATQELHRSRLALAAYLLGFAAKSAASGSAGRSPAPGCCSQLNGFTTLGQHKLREFTDIGAGPRHDDAFSML